MANLLSKLKSIGPAGLVTAAFIGPGTITACSMAGAGFGMALLWSLLFSVLATIFLQEMTLRLGIITQKGLGQSIRTSLTSPALRVLAIVLIVSAIAIGNAAYEAGNIVGASLGLTSIFEGVNPIVLSVVIGVLAFILLMQGSYKLIEKALVVLVILMSIVFLSTAIIIGPDFYDILKGMFVPSVPKNSILSIVGLIGTTVVPYNLFLHASAVKERWKNKEDIKEARFDLIFSIALGGIISMSVVITSAVAFFGQGIGLNGIGEMAIQLEPILGSWAKYFLGIGLFAAGVSSSITAPLAAAYATTGILGWKQDLKSTHFRLIWIVILVIGVFAASLGYKPIQAILFAQVTNGLLLPIIAIFLLVIMNSKKLLGQYANSIYSNVAGIIVIAVTLTLGLKSILSVLQII
ncbi:Nramp family divalent metal transporter [Carboxylicivirga sp. M1479]|uniref:Nramp family divalent metal transporter n=1 Tax=Carboxylicivirga sp. M1479 TaxID=2594476 RepID=UPI0011787229|nr:Nramp family divalent metal transporter [Carboxylicivirga sp. M1479]TRX66140.1 divalent metal cation transporter [Carboxylicivirga sp. M1479]